MAINEAKNMIKAAKENSECVVDVSSTLSSLRINQESKNGIAAGS